MLISQKLRAYRVNEDNSQNMYFFYKKNMILQEKNNRLI